jgi:hypothetical protein
MKPPIIKCHRGFAYGYVPIDCVREIHDLDEDGIFEASTDALSWHIKKSPPLSGEGCVKLNHTKE